MRKIDLDENGDDTLEFEFNEPYDMYTFVYTSKDGNLEEDVVELKTELGTKEALGIMEAVLYHLSSDVGLTKEEIINRYIENNKFRGKYEQ